MMWRDRKSPPLAPPTTADPAEIARFTALADALKKIAVLYRLWKFRSPPLVGARAGRPRSAEGLYFHGHKAGEFSPIHE